WAAAAATCTTAGCMITKPAASVLAFGNRPLHTNRQVKRFPHPLSLSPSGGERVVLVSATIGDNCYRKIREENQEETLIPGNYQVRQRSTFWFECLRCATSQVCISAAAGLGTTSLF